MKIYKPNRLIVGNSKYKSKKQIIIYDIFLNNNFIYLIFNPNYISKEEMEKFIFQQKNNNVFETCNYIESIVDSERKTEFCPAGGERCGILKYEYKSDDFIFKYKNYHLSGKVTDLNIDHKNKNLTISTLVHGPNYKFLKDWIEYHNSLGVDFFVIYLNDYNTEDPKELYLENLNKTNKYDILFVDWNTGVWGDGFNRYSFHAAQPESLNHCFYSLNSKYNIFIDVDEYIVLKKHKNLLQLLEEYKCYSDIHINNRWCGSNIKNVNEILFNEVFCSSQCLIEDENRSKTIILNKNNFKLIFVHGNMSIQQNSTRLDWSVAELRHYIDFNENLSKKQNIYRNRLNTSVKENGLTYET